MGWVLMIILILLVLAAWLLLTPLQLQLDTRIPEASLRWKTIGSVRVWHEEEWWFSFRVLFFSKKMRVATMAAKSKKRKPAPAHKKAKQKNGLRMLKKTYRVLRSFKVREWELALDTGDYVQNAWLYPLNYLPALQQHLQVNFRDENYLYVTIRNQPWRMLYAWFR